MKYLREARETLDSIKASYLNSLGSKWNRDPFAARRLGAAGDYEDIAKEARGQKFPDVDRVEREAGFAIDEDWLDDLALHTQITKKKSKISYPHGRLLYALLRRYVASSGLDFVSVLESGTARGFSSICLAKALEDSGADGRVVTVDVLPHTRPIYWDCIDDREGPKTRAELLQPWEGLRRRIVFLQGDTLYQLPRIGLDRINFAFLDAHHNRTNVLAEFAAIEPRQRTGDMIFFDDVTPAKFPGVVEAVERIDDMKLYDIDRLTISDARAYAWGVRR